ncbi:MAG: ATP-binding cassette domain-containing protein [Thermoanaerobaculia bacterium]
MAPPPLLQVEGLEIQFPGSPRPFSVVRGVNFAIERGEFVGLVGESGSGKSLSALALLGLVPPPAG